MKVRKAQDRGKLNIDWLQARHSFSFGSYFDPEYMGYKSVRVINNDVIAPGRGFDTHSHNNMEIITFVLRGEIEHKDTLGNSSIIKPGEIQLMSAGSGISHSEYNPNLDSETEIYQIWVETNKHNTEPRYAQFSYTDKANSNSLTLLASSQEKEGVALIYQDLDLFLGKIDSNSTLDEFNSSSYWLQVISGKIEVNGQSLETADGASFDEGSLKSIKGIEESEFLLFEFK